MRHWIISSNDKFFHLDECLKVHSTVTWRAGNRKFEVDDVVYIYATVPISRITYEMRVVRTGLDKPTYDDTPYYGEEWVAAKETPGRRVELQLVQKILESPSLTYKELSRHGLKGRIQGPRAISGELLEHIQRSIVKPKCWIVPTAVDRFRIHDYLQDHNLLEWNQNRNFQVDDIVFLYCGKPEQQIVYMLRVEKTDVPEEEWIDDREYSIPPKQVLNEDNSRVCRYRLMKVNNSERLTLKDLYDNGLERLSQWPSYNYPQELFDYIKAVFDEEQESNLDYEALGNPDGIYEGAKMRITVNRYERDRRGRERCIKVHGCRCSVCGLDFEKMYGEIGRGFIHVHHIVPISTIGTTYRLDPEKDLVPVCPNCHAMLHHSGDNRVLTVDELREIIKHPTA